ncbi:MAG: Hsp33 family molecular chaperone [Pseudomonadota bacterium]|nr:Hsp33 family molecular chaperone [Pseudomonadota bacterium]
MLSDSPSVSAIRPLEDDLVAPFQIEEQPARGRIVRLGAVVDEIISRHAYPEPVARLLGEACALAALVGASLKFEGRLIVQAQGDGPVAYVVADYDTSGGLRGYCRFDAERLAALDDARPGAQALLGKGVFIMTIDPANAKDRYQGVTAIEGDTLALSAEQYFAQSEQVPTKVRLAVGQVHDADGIRWRAGGMMIQNIAEDQARGSTADAWERAQALFATLSEDELIDPTIAAETLLFRLFHEDGVRLFPAKALTAFCRCSEDRVTGMLRSFPKEDIDEMMEGDGKIHVTCEYCSREYALEPAVVEAAAD